MGKNEKSLEIGIGATLQCGDGVRERKEGWHQFFNPREDLADPFAVPARSVVPEGWHQ